MEVKEDHLMISKSLPFGSTAVVSSKMNEAGQILCNPAELSIVSNTRVY